MAGRSRNRLTQRSLSEINELSGTGKAIVTFLGVDLIRRSGSRQSDLSSEVRNRARACRPYRSRPRSGLLASPTGFEPVLPP